MHLYVFIQIYLLTGFLGGGGGLSFLLLDLLYALLESFSHLTDYGIQLIPFKICMALSNTEVP
jgi:hypothetical protein